MSAANSIPPRSAVSIEQTWDAQSVYPQPADWHQHFEQMKSRVKEVAPYAGTLHQSPARLQEWMALYSELSRELNKLYWYAAMESEVDATNNSAREMLGMIGSLYGEFSSSSAFTEPELLAMPEGQLREWIAAEENLRVYAQYIDSVISYRAHVRSPEVESILGMVQDPFQSVQRIASELTNTDLTFRDATDGQGQPYPINQTSFELSRQSPDRSLRRSAFESYSDGHLAMKNTLAQTYLTSVRQNVFIMRQRSFDSVLHSRLASDHIPTEVFHQLINTFRANLPTWHRYWDVRRRALKLDSISPYDIWAPIAKDQPEVSYRQAVDWISEGVAPLGDYYVNTLRKGCLEDRWVDYSLNLGKHQGAFSGGTYDTKPFIMMSFDNSLSGMSTLAHELGHSMHSQLTNETQPYIYSSYSMFVAEVASNFNQAMTRAALFKAQDDNPQFQIALIEEAMDNFHRYFFIMPTLARFELEVHTRTENGQGLTAENLNEIMSDFFAEAYGSGFSDDRERTGITWAQFQHLYVPFYTFQYATGISAAHALAEPILAGDQDAAARYIRFLSTGSARYPIEALGQAGVEMSSPAAVEAGFRVLAQLVDRLEALTQ